MEKYNEIIKKLFLGIFLLFLIAPNIQSTLKLVTLKPLNGAYVASPRPDFSIKTYKSGKFQTEYNKYFEENIGFKEVLIRLYNSYSFLAYNQSNVSDVIVGKNGYFFNPRYIDAITGKNFIGSEEIETKVRRIKELQIALANQNKTLVVVFAPGKASYYKEYIPEHLLKDTKENNYAQFVKYFKENGVNFIDMKAHFLSIKEKSPYPLFTKYGTHWTLYGANLTSDSIHKFVESKSDIKFINKKYKSFEKLKYKQGSDYDLEDLMNLSFQLPIKEDIFNPIVEFDTISNLKKPNVLVVSDSYWWNIYNTKSPDYQYNDYSYYFYFNTAYLNKNSKSLPRAQTDVKYELDKSDIIIMMCTEGNDYYFPFGFTDYALATFEPEFGNLSPERKSFFIKKWEISHNKDWMEQIKKKAKENNVSINKQLEDDTEWALKN